MEIKNTSPLRYPGGKTRACKLLDVILNDHFNHRSDNRKLLWTLFCLENWLRINKGN